jgi:Mn2+/Fe2+ NRAMP family transporter
LFAGVCASFEIFSRYERYVSILKWGDAVTVRVRRNCDGREGALGSCSGAALIPSFSWRKDYVVAIVAVLGTTISPYLFFWQASEEAETSVLRPTRSR